MAPSQRLLLVQCNRKDPIQRSSSTTVPWTNGPDRVQGDSGVLSRLDRSIRRAHQSSTDSSMGKKVCPCLFVAAVIGYCTCQLAVRLSSAILYLIFYFNVHYTRYIGQSLSPRLVMLHWPDTHSTLATSSLSNLLF